MKKLFTILCAAVLTFSVSAQAQFGATAGLNMSNISGGEIDGETDMRLGIRLGVSAAIPLSDAMTLKTGALYSVKDRQFGMGDISADQSLNYLEIPLNLSFAVSDQMSLVAGPYLGFLIGTAVTIDGEDQDADTDGLAAMDIGITVGAGFAISEAISIDAGYQMGLTPLDEDYEDDVKNSNILIGMTFSFGGGY